MISRRRVYPFFIGGMVLVITAVVALTAGLGPNSNEVPTSAEVQKRVMSPFCPGLLLAECPTSQAAQLRARIEALIEEGWTNSQIDAWLEENYGEGVLATPRDAGAWIPPVIWAVAGAAIVGLLALGWSRRAGEIRQAEPLDASARRRLESELEQYAGRSNE